MMKKTFLFLLLSLVQLCAVSAAAPVAPWQNGRLVVSQNSRFLQHENGVPFFWLADTGWLLPQELDRQEAAFYLKSCSDAGYNVVQVQVLNGVPSINRYGQFSNIDGWDFSGIDRKGVYGYWDHMDYIVKTAERYGIYIGMTCIWGGLVKGGALDVEGARSYGTFLANRYANSPNIVWIIGGDVTGDVKTEVWDALAESIKAVDHNHLMTYHPRGRTCSARWFNDRKWLDFNMFQSGHRRYGQRMGNKDYPIPDNTEEDNWMYVDSAWSYKPIKPVLDGEPSYERIPVGLHDAKEGYWQASDVRRYAYWSVFAGSCGHTYGNNCIMQMWRPGHNTGYGEVEDMVPWHKALEDPGFNQMKYLKRLMLAFPYFDRVPDQSVIVKNGERYHRLIATRGKDWLMVYNFSNDLMQLDLMKISGSRKKVFWLDCASGNYVYVGEVPSKTLTFEPQPPHEGICDGVLIAFDAAKDYLDETSALPGISPEGSRNGREVRDLNE